MTMLARPWALFVQALTFHKVAHAPLQGIHKLVAQSSDTSAFISAKASRRKDLERSATSSLPGDFYVFFWL